MSHASIVFDDSRIALYERQSGGPVRQALLYLLQSVLADLPRDAHVLCVGVGTGTELVALAQAFPHWRFTAVDPAEAMMRQCRRSVGEGGFAHRCNFLHGYVEDLPSVASYDAVTCLLVSHFFHNTAERQNFLGQLHHRLKPGGRLVLSDFVANPSASELPKLLHVRRHTLRAQGLDDAQIDGVCSDLVQKVALLPPSRVAELIEGAGFTAPVLFYQALMMHAWFADKSVETP